VIGALVLAVVLIFVLPVAFLLSGTAGTVVVGTLLTVNAEATHEGSELLETNY
jgi:uncharacterized membrane protein YvlD (DUF360 family)